MSNYAINKARARTRNTSPTLTDQSQARETDINVIVGRFLKTGSAPGAAQEPIYGDFTQNPDDLAGFIAKAKSINKERHKLPQQLKNLSLAELMALTPEELKSKLEPPATPPAKEEEPK